MENQYSDLRKKTVLDFCQTEETEDFVKRFFLSNTSKENFKKRMLNNPELNAASLDCLAGYIGDDELRAQVYEQFAGYIRPPLPED